MTTAPTIASPRLMAYRSYRSMLSRCYSPKYSHYDIYGGRGITVCERWRNSFDDFLADIGPRPSIAHTLDRIEPNGNYEPSNCRWATRQEQDYNKRNTKMIEVDGETRAFGLLAKELGVNRWSLASRLKFGMPLQEAMTKGKGDNRLKKQVRHLPTGQIFNSIKEASIAFGIKYPTLRQRIYQNYPINEFEVIGGGDSHHRRSNSL